MENVFYVYLGALASSSAGSGALGSGYDSPWNVISNMKLIGFPSNSQFIMFS